jgi:hypothetical protein
VDNILLKLKAAGVEDFVRLGRESSTHQEIREFMPGAMR